MYINFYIYLIIFFFGPVSAFIIGSWKGFIFFYIIFVPLIVFADLYFMRRRSEYVVSILHSGDPNRFLEEIDKDLKRRIVGRLKDYLLINKTAGLCSTGRFDEALKILDSIKNPDRMQKLFKYLYINNKLASLLGLEQIQEAEKLAVQYKQLLSPLPEHKHLHYALKGNLAVLEYYKDDLVKSRVKLEECLENSQDRKLALANGHYFLGLIDLKQNNKDSAQTHLKKAIELGSNAFIAQKARAALSSLY